MAFLTTAIIALLILAATAILLPQLAGAVLGLVFRGVGWLIRRRTRSRREYVIARARSEEDEQARALRQKTSSHSLARSQGEDEDWEKVDSSAPSGAKTSSTSTSNDSGASSDEWDGVIGFFHPFCNAGGGGERVLWEAVRATQKRWPKAICAIYTGDHEVNKATMLERVENRFNIHLHAPTVVLLYLTTRKYVVSSSYPYMTLLGQSLGSLIVAYDAFTLLVPDVFIDTMGYAFTLAMCKWLFPTVPTGAYVHYPTISTDMLDSLNDQTGVKGMNSGAGKGLKGNIKRYYWQLFAQLYGWVGRHVDVVMCNSSWTAAHIRQLWGTRKSISSNSSSIITTTSNGSGTPSSPAVVFPPTAVSELESTIAVDEASEQAREPTLLYIAQFRPEKNHPLVLRSFARFLQERARNPASANLPSPRLVLIGSVRHSSPDETHIYNLRLLAHELRIRDHTTFLCDASWPTVLSHLGSASVGVNAMWNEHFGICVVEYQAAGLICVTHDSGGPREDIVVDLGDGATGFRAETEEQFAAAFEAALALPEPEKVAMRQRARRSARRFTEEEFSRKWLDQVQKLVRASR
ncbi:Glycosyl transferase family 1 [Penicillium macrosclerotiorum]|uniref:Glycosyl transferase family 1 n=1 Tax=Penicillium macrosclerotiorum TaxID=303699 RepID=UPI002547E7BF|nr:Glycosyl transferase family 1 [Penicillium macrosclerotiorum]KAJ5678701.1 Glycosyl transferase family 1 [Penicillium macrosclerotiorum]